MNAGFVSCDIIGHSGVKDITEQKFRIQSLNDIVKNTIGSNIEDIIWASGGDGGHLIFLNKNWHPNAIDYMMRLKEWAEQYNIPVRIIAHYGSIDKIQGASNYTQLVGDGINLCGHLLPFGISGGFVVTDDFKKSAEKNHQKELLFHSERILCLKHFYYKKVYLLSIKDRITSRWSTTIRLNDSMTYNFNHSMIELAHEKGKIWDVVYYAKRILQINANDKKAIEILHDLDINNFIYYKEDTERNIKESIINPFFKCFIDSTEAIIEIIKISQIIELNRNEILCNLGDEGDSLFIILQGEIGIFPDGLNRKQSSCFIEPLFSVTEGQIVGEIAFALKRKRSATLLALQKTYILTLNLEQIYTLVSNYKIGGDITTGISKFLKSRLLEFLCDRLDFLVGKKGNGPLHSIKHPWKRMVPFTDTIDIPWQERKFSQDDELFSKKGVFILVKGKVTNAYTQEELDCEEHFPIIFFKMDSLSGTHKQEYIIEEDITIIHIDLEKFLIKEPAIYKNVVREISRSLQDKNNNNDDNQYNVFISYRRKNGKDFARNIEQALKDKYNVYLDVESLGRGYFDENLLTTIQRTPNFILILTKDSLNGCSSPEDWVRKEVSHAINTNRNIIVIATEDFQFPKPSEIPKEIHDILRLDIIIYNHNYFKAMLDKIRERIILSYHS